MGNKQSSIETVKTPDQIRADNIREFVLKNPLPHTQIIDYDYYKSVNYKSVNNKITLPHLDYKLGSCCCIMSYDVICNAGDYSLHELVYPDDNEYKQRMTDFDAIYAFESDKQISLILDDDNNKHISLTYDLYTKDQPLCISHISYKKLFTIDQDNTTIKFKIMGFGTGLRNQMMNLNLTKGTYSANFQVRSCGGINSINF